MPSSSPTSKFVPATTIVILSLCLCSLISLYFFHILPVSRVPTEWYVRESLHGTDQNGMVTRGVQEAKKSHGAHSAVNPDYEAIPRKYITSTTGLPLANYAVMIDAGSSGSRLYVYQFKLPFSLDSNDPSKVIPGPDPSADILHVTIAEDVHHVPIVRKQEPGLSSFGSHPDEAFSSIEPLLQFASENIPAELHATTPVYVLATAGLRLLPDHSREAILAAVRVGLRAWSARGVFLFEQDDQADMITGEAEGLYGWIALNYVYNRFGDLQRTYPTGGLDPHTYGTLPRMTHQQFQRYRHSVHSTAADSKTSAAAAAADEDHKQSKSVSTTIHDHIPISIIVDNPSVSQLASLTQSNTRENTAAAPVQPPSDGKPTTSPPSSSSSSSPATIGLLEIGGGSSQVAFAVDSQSAHPPNYVFHIDLNLIDCGGTSDEPKGAVAATAAVASVSTVPATAVTSGPSQFAVTADAAIPSATDGQPTDITSQLNPSTEPVTVSPPAQTPPDDSTTATTTTTTTTDTTTTTTTTTPPSPPHGLPSSRRLSARTDAQGQVWPVGGHDYYVYTASFLGHGANAARSRFINFLLDHHHYSNSPTPRSPDQPAPPIRPTHFLHDPCQICGQAQIVSRTNPWGRAYELDRAEVHKHCHNGESTIEFTPPEDILTHLAHDELLIVGTGHWDKCRELLPQLLPPTSPLLDELRGVKPTPTHELCEYNCPINAQYQPPLTPEILANRFFGFSEYWFLTRDVLRMNPHEFSLEGFADASKALCDLSTSKTHWSDLKHKIDNNEYPESATEPRVRQQCFKGAWMATMLQHGHGIPHSRETNIVTPVSSIEGSEVQWSLGAVLHKVTQRLKNNRGFCQKMATQDAKFGLVEQLRNAETQFREDETTRLHQHDVWGNDASWDMQYFAQICIIVIIGTLIIACLSMVWGIWCEQSSQQNQQQHQNAANLYTRL